MDRTAKPDRAQARPFLGHGVGLRVPHYGRALAGGLDVDWVEIVSENLMRPGGRPRAVVEAVRREVPVVLHGVGLGVGSVAPLDEAYLAALRALADRVEPAWVSDHLCFTRVGEHHAHDLLPLPYTEEALALVVERIGRVQDALGRPLVLENVSSYVAYAASAMPEWEFVAEVARRADCRILLDLNNVIVSAANHGFAPADYLAGLPGERIWQVHLANHDVRASHRFDSHRGAVPGEVWALYAEAVARFGPISSLIEWDEDIPSWEVLRAEQQKAAATLPRSRAATLSPPRAPPEEANPSTPVNGSLAGTQALVWDVITYPTGAAAYAAAHPVDLAAVFLETAGFPRLERLELYADAYFWRLAGVLDDLFPISRWLLGRPRFHDLVTDYLLAAPSTSADIGRVGDRLAGFVLGHPVEAALPGVAEIALVEHALAVALHGPDDAPAAAADLAAIPLDRWPAARFRAVRTARLVPCRHDVAALQGALARGEPPPATPPPAPAGAILVWRQGFAARLRAPAAAESSALAALASGADFAALCEPASAPDEAAGWLARWVDDGLVARPDPDDARSPLVPRT